MDKHNIAISMISLANPWLDFINNTSTTIPTSTTSTINTLSKIHHTSNTYDCSTNNGNAATSITQELNDELQQLCADSYDR